jgi:hypothetical protein
MISTYGFLEPYVCRNYIGPRPQLNSNIFYELREKEILEAEKLLGYPFPSQLRQFYQEVGIGCLAEPHNPPPDYTFTGANEILHPLVVAHFARGEREWEGQDRWIAPDVLENLETGEVPFMDVLDSSIFMTLKAFSDNPNAVWCLGDKIEDSFEAFIRNLYYDDPNYYDRNW